MVIVLREVYEEVGLFFDIVEVIVVLRLFILMVREIFIYVYFVIGMIRLNFDFVVNFLEV